MAPTTLSTTTRKLRIFMSFLMACAFVLPVATQASAACTAKTIIFHNRQVGSTDTTSTVSQSTCAGATAPLKLFSTFGWSRTNYTFAGWATSPANVTSHTISYSDGANFTYTAGTNTYPLYTVWTDVKFKLHYDGLDVTSNIPDDTFGIETPAYVSNGLDSSNNPLITKAGYTLDHWQDGLGNSFAFGDQINGSADKTLYPVWVANLYFSYDANGGTGSLPPTNFTNNSSSPVSDPTGSISYDGYTFTCWNTSTTGTCADTDPGAYLPGDQLDQGVVLHAIWAQNHTIQLHLNPPTGVDSMTAQTTGGPHQITSRSTLNYAQVGYDFLGWSADPAASTATYTDAQVINFDGSISDLYAIWHGKTVRVTFNPGTADSGSPTFVEVTVPGQVTIPTSTYQKSGYVFSSWNSSSDGTGQNFTIGSQFSPTSSINLYPTWSAFSGPSSPSISGIVSQTPSSYVLKIAHSSVVGFTTLYSTSASGITISPEFGASIDTITVSGLLPNSGIPISVKYTSGVNSITYGVVGSSDLHSALGAARDPHFSASTIISSDSSHFSITDSTYDSNWSYSATISDGDGTVTYSDGVLTVSGLTIAAGQSIHATVTSHRENYLDGHNTFEITGGTLPILSNLVRNVGGYSFDITNFNPANSYSWSTEASAGSLATNAAGKIYLRDLAPTSDPQIFATTVSSLEPATNDHGFTRASSTISGAQVSQSMAKPFKTGSKLLVNPKTTGIFLPAVKLAGPTYLLVCINAKSSNSSHYAFDAGALDPAGAGVSGSSDNFPSNRTNFAAAHILSDNAYGTTLAIYGARSLVQTALNTNTTGLFIHNSAISYKNRWPAGDGVTFNFLVVGKDDIDPLQTANGFHGTTEDCQTALPENKTELIFSPLGITKAVIQTQNSLKLHR